MTPADPWSGIPDDLRTLVTELLDAGDPEALGYDPDRQDAAEAALCAALRALVADRERMEWLAAHGSNLREAIDAARAFNPSPQKEDSMKTPTIAATGSAWQQLHRAIQALRSEAPDAVTDAIQRVAEEYEATLAWAVHPEPSDTPEWTEPVYTPPRKVNDSEIPATWATTARCGCRVWILENRGPGGRGATLYCDMHTWEDLASGEVLIQSAISGATNA